MIQRNVAIVLVAEMAGRTEADQVALGWIPFALVEMVDVDRRHLFARASASRAAIARLVPITPEDVFRC